MDRRVGFAERGLAADCGLYFRILGSDLDLNSVPKELVLAIVVSALQAGLVWFMLPFFRGLTLAVVGERTSRSI